MRTTPLALLFTISSALGAQQRPPVTGTTPPTTAEGAAAPAAPAARRAPRPYAQVITARAVSDAGMITVHKVEDRWFFEVPDSILNRDQLLVSRIAGVPAGVDGFISAGTSLNERLVRFERAADRVVLRTISTNAYADDTLAIAISVRVNNIGPVLAAFPIQAFGRDSASYVLDVTEFLSGDTPALSGLSAAERRTYQVRRLDPQRSSLDGIKSFPMNVEVSQTQTFDAGAPPGDADAATITIAMRQSLVLLPRVPMRPRIADDRVGFFSVDRINYGLDQQKAATETFIRRWRLEPKDPAAYARGELVEPVKPIVYYLDPATPAKWRPYVRAGVNAWAKVFERAGFRNAVQAKDAPTKAQDPDWDAEDIRYSVVRWTASTVRNAVGPSTSDPRTGEIIESDITWYHNHMRSYRNRLLIETGAANPAARTLDIPEEVMGETMTQVITHEVGHALGLPHNMIASASFPTDSLRSRTFTSKYGVSGTIMDYARQNYVAQPGDGLAPKDFIRRLGPFDDFVIEWGYRVFPDAATPEAERPKLGEMLRNSTGMFAYRYLPQNLVGVDPRAQTEDLGDDPVASTSYALANVRKVVPELVSWTTRPGEDYGDLAEIHGELLGMWSLYMGHVTNIIGGMRIDAKVSDQAGPVWQVLPIARQRAALRFIAQQAFDTPEWLVPASVVSRIGPAASGSGALATRQANIIAALTQPARLDRMAQGSALQPGVGYDIATYMGELTSALFSAPAADANRRLMQRVYLERMQALIDPPPAPAAAGPGGGGGGGGAPQVNVRRSDISASARAQVRAVAAASRSKAATTSVAAQKAHWLDLVDRAQAILEPNR
ncbi:MAG TPA: zinc-dependent metalloprotease [Gemmatimonadaceae bacterium]|nr:zinc-dependent metalloprotease [Gemmatimonadaceae bacterium]